MRLERSVARARCSALLTDATLRLEEVRDFGRLPTEDLATLHSAPPWQRTPTRTPRRRRGDPLTTDSIVAAALRILDGEGLDGLSARRVAEELGTGAASLYCHVGSKDGLLDLVFDEVIGEQEVPDPERESFPNLVEVADHFTINDPDRRFELLLDLYVDGLAERARSPAG